MMLLGDRAYGIGHMRIRKRFTDGRCDVAIAPCSTPSLVSKDYSDY